VVATEDMGCLREHDDILNPPTASSLANGNCTLSHPAANYSLRGWNALAGLLFKDLPSGWEFFWHFGGWMDG